ncbi:hypothetical protein FOL47_011050 [Perkinsus chesapeaki]|uniref:F-actin-capping protein subunit beta n=1 Tax=Perkinsus chesapeaki TaxID=330153 RepID=A0A7J6KYR7_PERCH|nr:hypothetical protein FOL47_011050 [Perkinsus chesapeaki]
MPTDAYRLGAGYSTDMLTNESKVRAVERLLRFAIPAERGLETRQGLIELAGLSGGDVNWFTSGMPNGEGGDDGRRRRSFICHPSFNYDVDMKAYRVRYPGTNEYYKVVDGSSSGSALRVDGSTMTGTPLQELEALLDRLTYNYVVQYHGPAAVSSLYLKETQYGFCGVFLVNHKGGDGDTWESEQMIELAMAAGRPDIRVDGKVTACMTGRLPADGGDFRLSAEARRRTRNLSPTDLIPREQSAGGWLSPTLTQEAQVKAIGELLEENENCLRRQLEDVYMQKIKEIVDNLHSLDEAYVSKETATAIRDIRPVPGMAPHPLFAGELANVLKGRKRIE